MGGGPGGVNDKRRERVLRAFGYLARDRGRAL
jgi:hypothetical protein